MKREVSDQPKREGDCQISEGVDKQGQILIQERQGWTICSVLFTIFLNYSFISGRFLDALLTRSCI